MATTLDYTRSVNINLRIAEDRIFDAILDFSRSDDGEVDFTDKIIKMDVYNRNGNSITDTLTSGSEITILEDRLTFDATLSDLEPGSYKYRLYNDTDNIAIAWGHVLVAWG